MRAQTVKSGGGQVQNSAPYACFGAAYTARRNRTLRWAAVLLGLFGTCFGFAPDVLAHPESMPELVNRYITVSVHEQQFEVSVAWLHGQVPAALLRDQADRNKDHEISDQELAQFQRQLETEAASWLKVRLNGQDIQAPLRLSIDLGGQRSTGRRPLVVEGRLPLPLAGDPQHVALFPGPPPNRHGETEVMAVVGPGWELLDSQGPGGSRAFVHKSAANPSAPVAFVLGRQAGVGGNGRLRATLFGVAFAIFSGALLFWSRRRRQRPSYRA